MMLFLLLLCAWSAFGQDTVIQLTDFDKTDIVRAHNSLRGVVQPSAVNMGEMVWSDELASLAEDDVLSCAGDQHSSSGANVHITSIQKLDYEAMVQKWFSEGTDYDYYCNKCSPGKTCSHYSQAVWAMNRQVGCATAWCPYVAGPTEDYTTIVIKCYYEKEVDIRARRPYQIQDGCDVICNKCPEIVDSDCDCKSKETEQTVGATTSQMNRSHIINLHRLLRGSVTPKAIDMTTLRWDDELARQAQLYAESCTLTHSPAGYGENIQFTQGSSVDYNDTITKWYSEGEHYNYYCNHCKSGKSCDQYKQLVLASVRKMGCGQSICQAVEGLTEWSEVEVFVCLYNHSPSGVQRPYKSLDSCSEICKNCPEAEECTTCQISSSPFMAMHEEIIEKCPEECSYQRCSNRQKQICKIPGQPGCVTTSCRACMYLNETASVEEPRHCDNLVQSCRNPCDNVCTHKWARCVKQSLASPHKSTPSESLTYKCFVPPQQSICALLQH
ncbi:uncharacterized protein [Dysidea avara]|uniref:uncharacterized protein n=1 Tax=Dysidea avara TaxID=196820 RepID=UPI003323ED2D